LIILQGECVAWKTGRQIHVPHAASPQDMQAMIRALHRGRHSPSVPAATPSIAMD
jgi:hypothetical protein